MTITDRDARKTFSLRFLILVIFALQPLAFGAWLPRIPDVRNALGISPSVLALCLLGLPVGTLLALPFAGRFVARVGAKPVMFWGFGVFLCLMPLPGLAASPGQLFLGLFAIGLVMPTLELAMNISADRIERTTGKLTMNTAHGCWSLGIMAGSLIGSGLAAADLAPALAIGLVGLIVLPIALVTVGLLPKLDGQEQVPRAGKKRSAGWLPARDVLAIGAFVLGVSMTEGAVADWSALILRDVFHAGSGMAGLGYAVFAGFITLGRLLGDRAKGLFGPVRLARVCGVAALAGLAVVLLAPDAIVACLGFAVLGLGVSVGFPLAVSAAADLPGRAPETSVATVTFLALMGFLVGPVVIGTIADLTHIGLGLVGLVPFLVLSLTMIPALRPASGQSGATEPHDA